MGAFADRIRNDAIDSDHGERDGEASKYEQQNRLEAWARHGIRKYRFHRLDVGDRLVGIDIVDGGFDRTRNLIWVASGTDDDCCEIHWHLRIGEEDGWLRCIFQMRLARVGDDADNFDRFLEFPADLKLLSKNVLAREEAVHESVIDDGDVRGAEIVVFSKVAAGLNSRAHCGEIARADDEEL